MVQQYVTYAFLILVGAASWIVLETTHIAPPVCVVEQTLYDQAVTSVEAHVKRK